MYNFLRVGLAVPNTRTTDCAHNAGEAVSLAREAARAGVKIAVFPALTVTGLCCGDLFTQQALLDAAMDALRGILAETGDIDALLLIGMPLRHGNAVYACVIGAYKGEVAGIVPRSCLSRSGAEIPGDFGDVLINDRAVAAGPRLVFDIQGFPGGVLGFDPDDAGLGLYISLSTEPYRAGGSLDDRTAAKARSTAGKCAVVHLSCGTGESVTEGVYGGHALVCENGNLLAERLPFAEGEGLLMADVDMELISRAKSAACPKEPAGTPRVSLRFDDTGLPGGLKRRLPRNPFFPENTDEWPAFCQDIFNIQTHALASRISGVAAKKAVINVSGGLDSTLALLALAEAMDIMGRSREDVLGLALPGFGTTSGTRGNAIALMEALGISWREISIVPAFEGHMRDIGLDPADRSVTYENIQARERTQIALDTANLESGIMIGTGDMSEAALGFSTFGGDALSMYNPNGGVTKTAMRLVTKHLADAKAFGQAASEALYRILDTPVSPELLPPEDDAIAQLTEALVGPYELHDFFLYHTLVNGFAPDKIAFLAETAFRGAYEPETIRRWLKVFVHRFITQQYKRSCAPEGPAVFGVSLSPRNGLRMPGDASPAPWLARL